MINPYTLRNNAREQIHGVEQVKPQVTSTPTQPNMAVRGVATVGNVANNILLGAIKSLEGIVDAGAMLVGLFGANVDNFVEYDFTADLFGTDEEGQGFWDTQWGNKLAEVSYLDNDNIINQVAEGVGGMLPTVALATFTGGASTLANIATKASFIGGAVGKASESAFKEGASYGQALGYGAVSGAIEGATEMIGGRAIGKATDLADTFLGRTLLKHGGDKYLSKGLGKAVYSFASEGLEEVVADLVDPINKKAWGVSDKVEMPSLKDLGKTFLVGGAVGSVLDGVQGSVSALTSKKSGGKHFVNIAKELEDIAGTTKGLAYLEGEKSVSQETLNNAIIRSTERTMDSMEKISNELISITEEQRVEAFKDAPFLSENYNADGTIKEEVAQNYEQVMNSGAKYNVSSNLLYQGNKVEEDIGEINKQYGKNFELSDTPLNETQRKTFAKLNRNVSRIANKTGRNIDVVIVKKNPDANAFIDGNTIYLSEEHLEDGKWAKYLSHEVSHFAEDSKEYKSFADYISKDESALDYAFNKIVEADYDYSFAEVKSIVNKIKDGKTNSLTKKEKEVYTEIVAHITEKMFSDEASIERITRENKTLAQKILNTIKDFLDLFKGTNASRETIVSLRKAERLFEKALSSIGEEVDNVRASIGKASFQYLKDKKEYLKLKDTEKEKWLKEKGYKAEDFAEDVLGEDEENLDNRNSKKVVRYDFENGIVTYKDGTTAKFSLKDSDGNTLTTKQAEYFKDSKVRDADGNLLVVYHGTPNDGFTVFDITKSNINNWYGEGFYFSDYKGEAKTYGRNVIKAYLNIENPYIPSVDKILDDGSIEFAPSFKDDFRNKFEEVKNDEKLFPHTITEILKKNGYDGIAVADGLFVAFNSNQIKLTTNKNPTKHQDIRFSKKIKNAFETLGKYSEIEKNSIEKNSNFVVANTYIDIENFINKLYDLDNDKFLFLGKVNDAVANLIFQETELDVKGKSIVLNSSNLKHIFNEHQKINKTILQGQIPITEDNISDIVETILTPTSVERDDSNGQIGIQFKKNINGRITAVTILSEKKKALTLKSAWIIKNKQHISLTDNALALPSTSKTGKSMNAVSINSINNSTEKVNTNSQKIDQEYLELAKNPEKNEKRLREMVEEQARANGYTIDSEYQGTSAFNGKAPSSNAFFETKEDRIKAWENDEFEDTQTLGDYIKDGIDISNLDFVVLDERSYRGASSERKEAILNIRNAINSGSKFITMYRSVPISVKETKFRNGDWITPSKSYAVENAEIHGWGDDYKIIEQSVSVEDIWWDGNDIAEWGYDDGKNYAYKNTENNVKLFDLITYDDNGDIIPLSQRFDSSKKDIRFSRTMSSGEYAKLKANVTQEKVYSKKEATSVVNEIIDSIYLGDDIAINIANKSKEQVANEIWKFLNENPKLYKISTAEKITDYIMDSIVLEDALTDDDNRNSIFVLDSIRPYLHSFDLSYIKDEIKHRYGHGGAFALWGARKGNRGKTADQIAQELENKGIYLNSNNEADMFFEIIDMYSDAVKTLKEKGKKPKLNESLTDEDLTQMRNQIKMDILKAFDKKGSQTVFAKMIIESSKKAEFWKTLYFDERNRNRAENDVVFAIERLDSLKKGESVAHTEFKDDIFNKTIGQLTKLKHKKSFNRSGARNIIETLRKWATDDKNHLFKEDEIFKMEILPLMENIAENKTVGFDEIGFSIIEELQKKSGLSDIGDIYKWYTKENLKGDYNQLTKKFLSIYANEKKFTVQELKDIAKIVNYFRSFVESYNQIQINNERMDAFDMTKEFVNQISNNASRKYTGSQRMYLASMFNQKKDKNYFRKFIDGKAIARAMDRYEDGACTFIMDLLEQGEVEKAITTMNTLDELDKFYEKHKKFQKKVEDKQIKYLDKEIPLGNAMLLYMELKSDDALRSLCASGFAYTNKDNRRVEVQGFNPDILDDEDALQDEAKKLRDKLENQFDEADMQFIKICEDLFNNKLRALKVATDEQMLGFSNVIEGYYVPKMMADRSMKLEADKTYLDEVASVSNQSFNKSRIKGAYGRLAIESLPMVIKRHAEGIIKYHSFAQIERTINIVRNLDVGEDANNVQTVNTEMKKVWKDFDDYFKTLYNDIRGVSKKDSFKLFGWLRGNYAKAVLGLNAKVLASQLSSYGASAHILSVDSLLKGVLVKSTKEDVYKYCPLAEYRKKDNVSAQSQGVIDDVSSKFLEPISVVDGFVINRLFGACQVQVEKDNNLKIGTEENKVKAGELLKKVILETQQNNFKTSQVEGARSENELLKSFTMFKSDAIKNFGRWLDSYGELIFAKDKEAKKKAGKKLVKSSVVLISQASYLALLTSLFSHLFNTDDEDENDVWGFIKDAFGNLFGGIPIIGDVVNSFTSGFDVEDMAFGTINDVIDSARNFTNMFDANTDSRERARTLRSLTYSITSLLGLPVKNAYKLIYGTINLSSPKTAYKMDDFFYKQSYSKDLTKAIEKGDEGMLTTITGLIMGENVGGFTDKSREEVSRLSSKGYDALPQSVGDSMTISGETFELTTKDKTKFKKVYEQSIATIDKLVSSNGYQVLSDDNKAKAIKYVYNYYRYEAQEKTLGVELDSKLYLFGQVIPIEKLALILAEVPSIAEKSSNKKTAVQRYLQGSRLTSVQKYMLMGYFGYKNTNGKGAVESTINQSSLTKEQKTLLLEKCGY